MASVRESVRFNTLDRDEAKMLDYLEHYVQEGKKSAFIKDALLMYIEFIENGLYESPFIGEVKEEEKKSKFHNLIEKTKLGEVSDLMDDSFLSEEEVNNLLNQDIFAEDIE